MEKLKVSLLINHDNFEAMFYNGEVFINSQDHNVKWTKIPLDVLPPLFQEFLKTSEITKKEMGLDFIKRYEQKLIDDDKIGRLEYKIRQLDSLNRLSDSIVRSLAEVDTDRLELDSLIYKAQQYITTNPKEEGGEGEP